MKKFWKGIFECLFGTDMTLTDDEMYWAVWRKERWVS